MLAHWLPVRPKKCLSTRRKSVMTRPPAYQVAKVRNRMPVRRGLIASRSTAVTRSIELKKSYIAVWCTPTPRATVWNGPHGAVEPLQS